MIAVDIQSVLETYSRAWNLSKPNPQIVLKGCSAHILVIPMENAPHLIIRCGGSIRQHKDIKGIYIPLMLKTIMLPKSSSDHICGCEKLRYDKYPNIVDSFAKSFDKTIKFLYIDDIDISFDRKRINETLEGFIPVIVNKRPYSLYENTFKPDDIIEGYLCMGNCC